ncbi:hypothetical protein CAPTEDRAFT_188398 [Capitella teleta]|uniref:Uncharacterized protein n=1 Tax=Capitella teleta TaxID=283909 RepID=R7U048_CAPTE|nr:hypothetical protein CAPTEDRAFT_188398 [Capitella teleta]|eukprot:ELT96580.1 hypothetical protein CAPTEDRAFT_188398 [Capitella teleta]
MVIKHNFSRVPHFSELHNIIPSREVQQWKTDMPNRRHLIENAEAGGIPHFEHDDSLYLEKREQMVYNAESRVRVEAKYTLPSRAEMIRQPFHHQNSKYQSSLMSRRD